MRVTSCLIAAVVTASGCALAAGSSPLHAQEGPELYVARIQPVNPELTDRRVHGIAAVRLDENEFWAIVDARGLAPGMHLQHLHGFTDDREASCPGPDADKNDDGIIDLIETEATAGTTLIPLHEDPSSLKIKSTTYPTAEGPGSRGAIDYEESDELDAIVSALVEAYGISEIAVERRVIFLHGVPREIDLPASVQSLPGVPAHVTVPIACGEFVRLDTP